MELDRFRIDVWSVQDDIMCVSVLKKQKTKDVKIMNEKLKLIKLGENNAIKSVDLVDIINEFRKLESETIGKKCNELRHSDFMKKIRKEFETLKSLGFDNQRNFSYVEYLDIKLEKGKYSLLIN